MGLDADKPELNTGSQNQRVAIDDGLDGAAENRLWRRLVLCRRDGSMDKGACENPGAAIYWKANRPTISFISLAILCTIRGFAIVGCVLYKLPGRVILAHLIRRAFVSHRVANC